MASQVAIMQMVRRPESIQALGQGQADNEKYSHKNNKYGCCSYLVNVCSDARNIKTLNQVVWTKKALNVIIIIICTNKWVEMVAVNRHRHREWDAEWVGVWDMRLRAENPIQISCRWMRHQSLDWDLMGMQWVLVG